MSKRKFLIGVGISLAVMAGAIPAWAFYALTSTTVTPQPSAATLQPAVATASAASANSVTITWPAPSGQVSGAGYTVMRTSPTSATVCSDVSALSCTDSSLTTGTLYSYTVQTVDGSWQTTAVSAGSATPQATAGLVVTDGSASITAGGTLTFTATLTGPAGSPKPTGAMTWTITGTATACSSTTPASGTTPAWTYTCSIANAAAGTYSATASLAADGFYQAANGSDNNVKVAAVAGNYSFLISAIGTQTAGAAFGGFTVQLQLNGSNTGTFNSSSYGTSHTLTLSGSAAAASSGGTTPTASLALTFNNGGLATAPATAVTLYDAQTSGVLTLTDSANTIAGSSAGFTVKAASVALSFTGTCPSSLAKGGGTFTTGVSRATADAYGNADPNKSQAITVSLAHDSSPVKGSWSPATLTIAANATSAASPSTATYTTGTGNYSDTLSASVTAPTGYASASCGPITVS